MEIDHIFICVKKDAPESELLREFGLIEGAPSIYHGEETANKRYFFKNAFIDLLWINDMKEILSEETQRTNLFERFAQKSKGAAPFGICFRPAGNSIEKAPFPTWSYKPHYLQENLEIEIGEGTELSEPMWLFIKKGRRPDSIDVRNMPPMRHKESLGEITNVSVHIKQESPLSKVAEVVKDLNCVEIVRGSRTILEIEFDHEKKGMKEYFTPDLPLVFKW